MKYPIKKIIMQFFLFIVFLLFALNQMISRILGISWFFYLILGLCFVVVLILYMISKSKKYDELYVESKRFATLQKGVLFTYLIAFLLMVYLDTLYRQNAITQPWLLNNFKTISWVLASLLVVVSIIGLISKYVEFKKEWKQKIQ